MPVMAPDLKASSSPAASEPIAACAVRTLARTDTFMPMKPVMADKDRPDREAGRHKRAEEPAHDEADDDTDDADGRILALQISLRALAHRRRDLLHPGTAGVRRHDGNRRPDAIADRQETAGD